ncbi:MAG: sulfite exporter TauE/SafE family protein [Thermodesulfobacteriota bacterium]
MAEVWSELPLIIGAIVVFASAVETFSGFAGAMIALSLGAHFYPVEKLVPIWVVLNFFMNSYILLRHRDHVAWALLLKQALPFMSAGVLFGLWVFPYLTDLPLKRILGGLIIVFTGSQLIRVLRARATDSHAFARWQAGLWQFLAGGCHAIYATGGPLVVYSLSRRAMAKSVFRATLCTLWAMVNAVLIPGFVLNGRLDSSSLKITAWLLPGLCLGIFLGEIMHGRINERPFRLVVLLLLLVVGVTLII